MLQNVIPVCLL